jgi:hypothetical protein
MANFTAQKVTMLKGLGLRGNANHLAVAAQLLPRRIQDAITKVILHALFLRPKPPPLPYFMGISRTDRRVARDGQQRPAPRFGPPSVERTKARPASEQLLSGVVLEVCGPL